MTIVDWSTTSRGPPKVASWPVPLQTVCAGRWLVPNVCHLHYLCVLFGSRVWSLERSAPPLTLPHPCFVYGVQFAASAAIVCTAGYDACLRVWRLREESVDLMAELREHRGLVNCLASDGGRSTLYSCDSVGGMCIWTIRENAQLQRKVKVTEVSIVCVLYL